MSVLDILSKPIIGVVIATAIFVLDLLLPYGHAVPMLYVVPILLTSFVAGFRSTALMAAMTLILTWATVLYRHVDVSGASLDRRALVSVLYLVVAALLIKQKQLAKKAAEAYQARCESDERLHLAMDIGQMAAWDWNVVENTVTYSATLGSLFRLPTGTQHNTYEEFLHSVHPDDRERIGSAITLSLGSGLVFSEEYRTIWPDGTVRWLSGRGQVYRDRTGKPTRMIGILLDVTLRKEAEDAMHDLTTKLEQRVRERTTELTQANERFEWVIKATSDGVYDWDLVRGTVQASPRWKAMHGFQTSEIEERVEDWSVRIHPNDRHRVLGQLQDYMSGKRSDFWEEYRIRRKDGTYMWVLDRGVVLTDEQGCAYRMVGAETDITWRKGTEEALRRREYEFHTLADNVPALFAYVDRDRRYQFVNHRYETDFGRSSHEIVGMSVRDLIGPAGYARVQFHLDDAFRGEPVSYENHLPMPDGTYRWLSVQYVPDWDEQGTVVGLFVLAVDVTAIKSSEATLREREAQLRDLNAKLLQVQENERRRLARELHDDFTQRLAAVTLDLRTLGRKESAFGPEFLSRLATVGNMTEQLTRDLQQVSHQLHPSLLEHAGLDAAIREYVDEFATRTRLSIDLTVRNVPRSIPLEHATCLYRILQESLQNVRKHADATSIFVRLLRTGRGVGLCIHDDGRGLQNIAGTMRGYGLGLTSMAERVGILRGTFRIKTKPGNGTEVHAWIPLDKPADDGSGKRVR